MLLLSVTLHGRVWDIQRASTHPSRFLYYGSKNGHALMMICRGNLVRRKKSHLRKEIGQRARRLEAISVPSHYSAEIYGPLTKPSQFLVFGEYIGFFLSMLFHYTKPTGGVG